MASTFVELACDRLEHGFDAGPCHGARQSQPLALGELHGHQLTAPRHQGGEILLLGVAQGADEPLTVGPARQDAGKLGQGCRINAVGLGQSLHCPGEIARHARIDHGHAKSGRLQRARQRRFVAAGGFHQYQRRLQPRQPVGQRAVALGVVVDATEFRRKLGASGRHIDVRAGHVDSYRHE